MGYVPRNELPEPDPDLSDFYNGTPKWINTISIIIYIFVGLILLFLLWGDCYISVR